MTTNHVNSAANLPNIDGHRQIMDQYENPYFLHSSDHAGMILVSDHLASGSDFHSWRRSMRMALNVRNKLGFINGSIPQPPSDHCDSGSWSRCNDMVSTWITNSVPKKIGQSLLFVPTAEGICKSLMSPFKQDDAPRVFQIEQRLNSIQKGAMDVTAYYTELVTLWEEYKNYVELHVCSCGKYECNTTALREKLQQRGRVTKFLMGLNEVYEPTHRHILMLKPVPSIDDVFHMVESNERQKTLVPSTKVDKVVFQSTGPPDLTSGYCSTNLEGVDNGGYYGPIENVAYAAFRPIQKPFCTHCGRSGHTVQKCYKLHGYPPGHKFGLRLPPNSQGYSTSYQPCAQSQPPGVRPQPQQSQYQFPRPNA
ncbi:PREDICTED: uncharacterized protein LOC104698703 [Camelina sativa]|uniref:Uncharacterized protein LOC104698703 n=1 Tax=Camelina sativa TaxID=90675 RepID=A0ABM0SKE5_CAMSA|nr:PREDICTED: uncharacterized protein LOC104698703 [Camelina sativa]